jgi:tetratricopeptide (TPR) repeat protein
MSSEKKSVSLQQLLLIVGAVVVAILLFQLPKMVVKNAKDGEKEEMSQKPAANRDKPAAQSEDIHKVTLSSEEKSLIMSLRKQYKGISDKEKKRIFADSLVNTYLRLNLYDSVAVFMDEVVKADDSRANLLKAGESWVQSAGLSSDATEQTERIQKGRAYYQRVLDKNAKDEEARILLGLSYFGTEQTMDGVLMLREVVKDNPDSEMGHYYLGLMGMQSGQYDKAADRFEKVVKINPENSNAWFQLGLCYKELGKTDKAEKAYTRARSYATDAESKAMIDDELEKLK